MIRNLLLLNVLYLALLPASTTYGHFVWMAIDKGSTGAATANVYFSEMAEPDDAKLLQRLSRIKVWQRTADGQTQPLAELKTVQNDDGGMLQSPLSDGVCCIESDCLYGRYTHGDKSMLLHYFAKSLQANAAAALRRSQQLLLDIVPVAADGELTLQVLWHGEPVANAPLSITAPDGNFSEALTDDQGRATLPLTAAGRYEIRTKQTIPKSGRWGKKRFDETRYYCTATLQVSPAQLSPAPVSPAPADSASPYQDLPRGITSFGGAIVGDYLYLYGGHYGKAHQYNNTSQSCELSRLPLNGSGEWEVVAHGPRLQGLSLVAHDGLLYRIGGFTAHNPAGEEDDLRSVDDFVRFDPATMEWETLPPLPEPRSSFDAVVLGDKLYLAGGWNVAEQDWHTTAWVMDLSSSELSWEPLPSPPFERRALTLGHLDGKVYVLGGMRSEDGPTTRVDIYDPATNEWSLGPDLAVAIGEDEDVDGLDGFGPSAFHANGRLYVSTYGGHLLVLDSKATEWRLVQKLKEDRFFHRMLPYQNQLLLIGGASMTSGKRLGIETVDLSAIE